MSHAASKDKHKIHKLPQETSRQIETAQIIPSFDSLIASLVLSSIASHATNVTAFLNSPNALDLSIIDNGAAIRADVWPQICVKSIDAHHPRGSVLNAAATFSNLTLTSSSTTTHRRKSIHSAQLIADILLDAPSSRLHPHRGGVIVDIRQLFENIPVRRYAALQLSEPRRQDAIRRRILAIALCNPSVSIRVLLPNNHILFESRGRSILTLATLSKALALRSKPKWNSIEARQEFNNELHLFGFIAPHALARQSDDAQIVAVNGVPLERTARVHALIRKAVRQSPSANTKNVSINRTSTPLGGNNTLSDPHPYAAYVLNVNCARDDISVSAYEYGAHIAGHNKIDVETFVADKVTQSLHPDRPTTISYNLNNADRNEKTFFKSQLEDFRIKMSDDVRKRSLPVTASQYPSLFSSTLKRQRLTHPNTPTTTTPPARRPLSASELKRNRTGDEVRPLSSNSQVQRPKSASAILTGIAKTVPNWLNPCYRFPGRNPRSIAASRVEKRSSSGGGEGLNMYKICVERDKLNGMRVIGQVDRKFIFLVDTHGTIYALDQHAASERAHFERMLHNVRQRIRCVKLKRGGMKVPLSSAQYSAFRRFKEDIERWGWCIQLNENARSTSVIVKEVPQVEGTRVRLDSAQQLVQFVDSLSDGASGQCTPAPLVHAIASVACHTAVRFGDELTHEQCSSLVDGLILCEAPFQCAHGRPSIVPLTKLVDE